MKLFSWFMETNDMTSSQVGRLPLDSNVNKKSAMWPIAQVRNSTQINQQEYISTVLSLSRKEDAQLNIKKT